MLFLLFSVSGRSTIRMSQQHNSHVLNSTMEQIKVALTDRDNRLSTQIISTGAHVCFPTPHGRVTLSVFRQLGSSQFSQNPEAAYTDDSDRSFIVKQVGDTFNIERTVYGTNLSRRDGITPNVLLRLNEKGQRRLQRQCQQRPFKARHRTKILLWEPMKINNIYIYS